MTEVEALEKIVELLGGIFLIQFFLFLKTIFGMVAKFINGFLD